MKSFLYYSLLVVLLWLPLPEGSKPVWAMMILAMLIFLLASCATISYALGHLSLSAAFKKAAPLHLGFLLVVGWLWFQHIPLPVEWVETLSPNAAQHYLQTFRILPVADGCQLTASCPITLSIDPHSTFISALLSTAYYLLFCLTLLLVDSRKRLEKLLLAMVAMGTFQAIFGALSALSGSEWLLFREKTAYLGVATGTFVNRNSFAGFLEMTLAAGMGLLIARLTNQHYANWRDRLLALLQLMLSSKLLLRVALATMVIGLVLSRSRMGNAAFFSSLM